MLLTHDPTKNTLLLTHTPTKNTLLLTHDPTKNTLLLTHTPLFSSWATVYDAGLEKLENNIGLLYLVQQICDENQTKGSVSDKSNTISRTLAEMILFEISYGPKLKKSKMAVIFRMAAKFKKKSQNCIVIINK